MKRTLVIVLTLHTTWVALTAQPAAEPGTSITNDVSGSLFTNELDAAFSVYEDSSGPGFSELEHSYLFGGLDNGRRGSLQGAEPGFFVGYFRSARRPWSLYLDTHIDGVQSETIRENDEEGRTSYEQRLFDHLDAETQFLMHIERITTGVRLQVVVDDDSETRENFKRVEDELVLEREHIDRTTELELFTPLFFRTGMSSHYIEPAVRYRRHIEESRTVEPATHIDDKSTRIVRTVTPSIRYRYTQSSLTRAHEDNEFSITVSGSVGFTTADNERRDNTSGEIEVRDEQWERNCSYSLELRQDIYLSAPQWIRIAIAPRLFSSYIREWYNPRKILFSGGGPPATVYYEDYDMSASYGASLQFSSEIKVDAWPIGIMIGAEPTLSFYQKIQNNPNVDGELLGSRIWTTQVVHEYGLFVPLPDGFRLDLVSSFNVLELNQLVLQLIVPLDWSTAEP